MSRSRSVPFPASSSTSTPTVATPGSIFFAKEMPASKNQVTEVSKDTGVRKIGPPGNKIRIRLPPRKRLAESTQTTSTVVPDDTKNHLADVSEHTDDNMPSTALVDTKVKVEEVCSKATKGKCEEANILIKTMSKDTLSEEANLIVLSLNPTTTTEVQVKEEIDCPVRKELCEERDKNIMRKVLPLEDRSNTLCKESYVGPIDNTTSTTSENLSVLRVHGEVEKNNSSNIIPSNRLIYGTNSNSPIKGVTEEAKINSPRKNLTTSAVKREEENGKSLGSNLFEEGRKNIMSTEAINCAPSRRPADPTNDKKFIKKPRTYVVHIHAAGSSQNLTTSAVKREEENDKSLGSNLFEEGRKNIMSTEAINCAPSRRPADPANDKKSIKKPRTSVVHIHAAGPSQSPSGMKLSTSVDPAVEQSTRAAFLEATKEYKEFEEKVKRTVYLDNLSLLATDAVITMALNQFGNVKNINRLTNYTVPFDIPKSALVEMETEKDAEHVVNMLDEFPFMVSGMPRPVRASSATAEMFSDRPRKPGKKLEFCWVGPTDPDCHNVRKFKLMSKRHEVENLALIKNQLQEEAILAKHQQDNLNCNYRKLESIDSVILTGCVHRLTRIYNLSLDEVY